MPLPDGTLTADEFAQVSQKLFEFWALGGGKKPCPQCGYVPFFIHPALIGNRSDTVSVGEAHTRLPTVVVYCQRCGYADHYAARMLGIQVLLPAPPTAAPPPPPPPDSPLIELLKKAQQDTKGGGGNG